MSRSRAAIRRVNTKALIGTAVAVVLLVGGVLLAAAAFRGQMRDQLLGQARTLEEQGNPVLALRHLGQYLDRKPGDVEVLDLYAELLSEVVLEHGDPDRLDAAIAANERLLRLDPEGALGAEDPQRNRRWLAEMDILKSEMTRASYGSLNLQMADEATAMESRYLAAEQVARDLIEHGAEDAEAYRLLAIALEGSAGQARGEILDEVVGAFEDVLARDPGDAEAAGRLARLYRDRRGDPESADRVLGELVDAAPDSPESWLTVYRHYAGTAEADRATQALARAVELAPDDAAVVLAAAGNAIERDDYGAARSLLAGLPEHVRKQPDVELMRATIEFRDRQSDEAIARLQAALRDLSGAEPRIVWTLANALINAGRLAEAQPLVKRYAGLAGPDREPAVRLLRGLLLQKLGRLGEAIAEFDAAERDLNNNDAMEAQLLVARGRCKQALGDRFEATRDFRAAVGLAPESPAARLALVDALGADEALGELRRGLTAAPESTALHRELLERLLAAQAAAPRDRRSWAEFDAAMQQARAVPDLADDPTLDALDARRQLLDGRTDAALATLEQAVARGPKVASLWLTWADALAHAGRREEALAVLERGSAPEAAGDGATFRIARAQLLAQLGRGGEAIALLADRAAALPAVQRPAVLQALGQMQAARGQFAEARASYTAWKRLQPGAAAPPLALLGLAIETGDRPAAEAALNELRGDLSLDPGLPYLLGRAEFLLRMPGGASSAEEATEAVELLRPILGDEQTQGTAPELTAARLLRGLALDRIGRLEADPVAAAAAFEKAMTDLRLAWEGGEAKAAAPLVDLLVRLDRPGEIDRLPRLGTSGFNTDLDRLAAEAFLRHNRPDRAAEYVDRATQAAPDTPQAAAWTMTMRDRLGQTRQVEEALRRQAEQRGDAASWLALIRYQAARGFRDRAEASIAAMKQGVDDQAPALLEAQAREALGDLKAAADAYDAALAAAPDDPTALLAAARFDQANGRVAEALRRIDQALAAAPTSRPAARFKALLLADLATDSEAWDRAWEALGPEPSEAGAEAPRDRLARAIVLARHPDAGRRDDAVRRLEALVEDQPSGDVMAAAARETLAKLLLKDRPERAAEIAAVTAIASSDPAAVALYAQALIAAGQIDEAARQIERLKGLAPGSAALAELELLLVETDAEAASLAQELEASYQNTVAEAEGDSAATAAAATFRRLLRLGEPALEVADRVGRDLAERFPTMAWLPAQWLATRDLYADALDLAEAAIASGDAKAAFEGSRAALTIVDRSQVAPEFLSRANELIERAAALPDAPPGQKAVLGMLRHFQGRVDPERYDDEIRIYRELLVAEPNNPVYLNNLAWALSECGSAPDEALAMINHAFEALGSRPPELLDTRGAILHRLGKPDEAIADFNEVVSQLPDNPVYHFHLARSQAAAGQTDAARATLAHALKLGLTPDDLEPFERQTLEELKAL